MRLNQWLARAGVASRRKADELIAAGRVTVNSQPVADFSYQVQEDDAVAVDGQLIQAQVDTVILALNKPRGVTSTVADAHAERTVMEFVPPHLRGMVPIGRLDQESEGLLLLTNNGALTNQLTHPSFGHEKEYIVTTKRRLNDQQLRRLATGVKLEEGNTGKCSVQRLGDKQFSIVLTQGWKRQIRRMVEMVGAEAVVLQRVRIGKLRLGDLASGQVRVVQKSDIF